MWKGYSCLGYARVSEQKGQGVGQYLVQGRKLGPDTGANGRQGGWCVQRVDKRGYRVHG